ncbi:MAG: sodium:solute symporter family protein, partial [Nitrospinaceae bacterium]
IEHRFGSPALRAAVALIMIYVLCNYTLAQMKILGTALAGISQGRVPLWVGVTGLALVMLIYESMGGMRSVAWTDVMQGTILILGFFILMGLAFSHLGGLPEAVDTLAKNPATRFKVEPPDGDGVRTWMSFILMAGLGGALYPQALQRVYAARNVRALKRSLVLMGFMPLLTGLVAVAAGVLMAAHRPGLDRPPDGSSTVVPSETALARLCLEVMQTSDLGYWLVVILFAAILAAVMSTADSALLSISSMVTRDLYGRFIRPQAAEADLCRVGRWVTFLLMAPIVWLALNYQGTIIQLIKIKFDIMIQCVPAFYLGVHVPQLRAAPVLAGLALGVTVALGLILAGYPTVWGFHSGVWGLVGNLALCGVLQVRGKTVPGGRN